MRVDLRWPNKIFNKNKKSLNEGSFCVCFKALSSSFFYAICLASANQKRVNNQQHAQQYVF